jgi:hypothetical protein
MCDSEAVFAEDRNAPKRTSTYDWALVLSNARLSKI